MSVSSLAVAINKVPGISVLNLCSSERAEHILAGPNPPSSYLLMLADEMRHALNDYTDFAFAGLSDVYSVCTCHSQEHQEHG